MQYIQENDKSKYCKYFINTNLHLKQLLEPISMSQYLLKSLLQNDNILTICKNKNNLNNEFIIKMDHGFRLYNEMFMNNYIVYHNIQGFTRYFYLYSCIDELNPYNHLLDDFNDSESSKMRLYGLITPYFALGSLQTFDWSNETIPQLKECFKMTCKNYMNASTHGFIHGNLHANNVMITNSFTTYIIDYQYACIYTHDNLYSYIAKDFIKLFSSPFKIDLDFTEILEFLKPLSSSFRNTTLSDFELIYKLIDNSSALTAILEPKVIA